MSEEEGNIFMFSKEGLASLKRIGDLPEDSYPHLYAPDFEEFIDGATDKDYKIVNSFSKGQVEVYVEKIFMGVRFLSPKYVGPIKYYKLAVLKCVLDVDQELIKKLSEGNAN